MGRLAELDTEQSHCVSHVHSATCCRAAAASTSLRSSKQLRQIIESSGAEVAVAYRTLDGKTELFVDGDKPFHAASTMKVPVMIELFRQARTQQLSLDDTLTIRNEFRSIVDGSPYSSVKEMTRTHRSTPPSARQ